MSTGIEIIANMRRKMDRGAILENEECNFLRLTSEDGDLALAAACYAIPSTERYSAEVEYKDAKHWTPMHWPWPCWAWEPTPDDRIRELAKAGALIAAEIDRLQGLKKKELS